MALKRRYIIILLVIQIILTFSSWLQRLAYYGVYRDVVGVFFDRNFF